MIGPALERDAIDPYALRHAPQSSAEPLWRKIVAGIGLFAAASVFAWIGLS